MSRLETEGVMLGLPRYLREIQEEIEQYARAYGLDFFTVIFEVLTYEQMNEIAAYGGFPNRYPHWRFGMEYEHLSKSHAYGLSKIYEMVINNDPTYAYLLEGNSTVEQKLVMAHVHGHVDFFKNNFYFSKTNRRMIDEMANHGARVRRYMERHGVEAIEQFIDVCLSLENLIDPYSPYIERVSKPPPPPEERQAVEIPKLKSKDYMDSFINPKEFVDRQRQRLEREAQSKRQFPGRPQRDVLLFLLHHAPLSVWERDILEVVRDEAYYYAPQGMTKIMNEGWASYWHSRIMTEKALRADEVIDYADRCASVLASAPGRINPYKMGVELFRNIEERWDRGQFGKEWEDCDDLAAKRSWDQRLGLGRKKIFEVRALYNDVTFLDEFLTYEFCVEQKLFSFGYNGRNERYEIESREFKAVKDKFLGQVTNLGNPFIYVKDGNYDNRGELLLFHDHQGADLKIDWARDTLCNLFRVWRRPTCIETVVDGKPTLLRYDGTDHSAKALRT